MWINAPQGLFNRADDKRMASIPPVITSWTPQPLPSQSDTMILLSRFWNILWRVSLVMMRKRLLSVLQYATD